MVGRTGFDRYVEKRKATSKVFREAYRQSEVHVVIVRQARKIFAKAFPGKDWPEGWIVETVKELPEDCCGFTYTDDKLILISRKWFGSHSRAQQLDTLIHEFLHMLDPKLAHGRTFSQRVSRAKKRVL